MASRSSTSGSRTPSSVPGEPIILVADNAGRIESFVSALGRFPTDPRWALIGGFAVNVRIAQVHRLTNDIDTVSQDQPALVEILLAEPDAEGLSAAKLRFTGGDLPVDIDVMGDMADHPLAGEPSEQAFTLGRRNGGGGGVMVSVGFGGGAVAEAGVEPAGVVPALDPGEHGPVEPCAGGPRSGVDQFAFDGREERLGHRVAGAIRASSPTHVHDLQFSSVAHRTRSASRRFP